VSAAPARIEELAALCAAGAASASERAEFESLAASDPGARQLMREYADAASLLAFELPPLAPPAGALDAVRRRVVPGGAGPGMPGVPPPGGMPGPGADVIAIGSRRSARVVVAVAVPLAAAAAFAVLWLQERGRGASLGEEVAALTTERDNERRVRTRVEQQVRTLERERDEVAGALRKVSTPELQLATVKDPKNPKGVVLKILIDPLTASWYVMAFQVPEADPSSQDYQLWFVDREAPTAPVASELFRTGPAGALQVITRVPEGIDPVGAAISLEAKGGSTTGKPGQVLGGGELL